MKICLTGDLFLGGDLLNKNTENIIDVNIFNSADKRIVNLEQPISDSEKIEDKCTLFTGSFALKQLKDMKIDAVNLAHNHIQDKGLDGINETIKHLNSSKIGNFGAGNNINEAKKPYFIDENIAVLGYCEFDKSYLMQIEVAGENKAGVNTLRYESIIDDLNNLKETQKVILYFHWGREHVFLPPHYDIELAKKLLEDERVLLIVGMHPHRPQGYIEHNGKKAYMCLGNFLFPNFYIKSPTQIYYPDTTPKTFDITRQYHGVFKITYKKWRWINRVSLVLEYDSVKNSVIHKVVIQDDNQAIVTELSGLKEKSMLSFIWLLSQIYKIPKFIYNPIESINSFFVYKIWRWQIYLFQFKQLGIIEFSKKFLKRVKRKLNKVLNAK
jgi:poly-gamma-glutamate synthesis protein (capsule biosynthesis protein)